MQRSTTRYQEDQQPITSAQKFFQSGLQVLGHEIERSDLYRMLRIDNGPSISFSAVEYRLILLFLECKGSEVSYITIATDVYGYGLDEELLLTIRKRVSTIRGKIADYGLDIVNIPHHGYMMRDLTDLAIPYRCGDRARSRKNYRSSAS